MSVGLAACLRVTVVQPANTWLSRGRPWTLRGQEVPPESEVSHGRPVPCPLLWQVSRDLPTGNLPGARERAKCGMRAQDAAWRLL